MRLALLRVRLDRRCLLLERSCPVSESILGKTVVAGYLVLPTAIEYDEPTEYAGQCLIAAVSAGRYAIKLHADYRGVHCYVEFESSSDWPQTNRVTLQRSTWNGKPDHANKIGKPTRATSSVYLYELARGAAGLIDSRRWWGGKIELADGWKLDPRDDSMLLAPTGELVAHGRVVQPDGIEAEHQRLADLRATPEHRELMRRLSAPLGRGE